MNSDYSSATRFTFSLITLAIICFCLPSDVSAMDDDHDIYAEMKRADLSVIDAKSLYRSLKFRKDYPDCADVIANWSCKTAPICFWQRDCLQRLNQDQTILKKFVDQEFSSERNKVCLICNRIEVKKKIYNIIFYCRRMNIDSWIDTISVIAEHKNLLDMEDIGAIKKMITEELFFDLLIKEDSVLQRSIDPEAIQKFNAALIAHIKPLIDKPAKDFLITQDAREELVNKWKSSKNIEVFGPFMFDYGKGLLQLKREKTILQDWVATLTLQDTEQYADLQYCLDRINVKMAIGRLLGTIESNRNSEYVSKISLDDRLRDIAKGAILPGLLKSLTADDKSQLKYFSLEQVFIMNQIIKISDHILMIDDFDKAEIANSWRLKNFLNNCIENSEKISESFTDSGNRFLLACGKLNDEIKRIKEETKCNNRQRYKKLCSMIWTIYPYPDNHFIEIVEQMGAIRSLKSEKLRSLDGVIHLDFLLSEYEKILNQHIEGLIDEISKWDTLSHSEWTTKIAAYFPQDNSYLINLLKERGYQSRIDEKLASLEKKEQEKHDPKKIVGIIKDINNYTFVFYLALKLISSTEIRLSINDITSMQKIMKLAECVQYFDDLSKVEIVSSTSLSRFLQTCLTPSNRAQVVNRLNGFSRVVGVPSPEVFLSACEVLNNEIMRIEKKSLSQVQTSSMPLGKPGCSVAVPIKVVPAEDIHHLQSPTRQQLSVSKPVSNTSSSNKILQNNSDISVVAVPASQAQGQQAQVQSKSPQGRTQETGGFMCYIGDIGNSILECFLWLPRLLNTIICLSRY